MNKIASKLEILERIKNNIEDERPMLDGIVYKKKGEDYWEEIPEAIYDIYPTTITVNDVEVPRPLYSWELEEDEFYFIASHCSMGFEKWSGGYCMSKGYKFVYDDCQKAIEASKALFGM